MTGGCFHYSCVCLSSILKTHWVIQVQVLRRATGVQRASWWRSGGVCPPAVLASTPQSQVQSWLMGTGFVGGELTGVCSGVGGLFIC